MRLSRAGPVVLLGIAVASFSGCRPGVRTVPPPSPPPAAPAPAAAPGAAVTRTGYTVQVGAFSVVENARRLAQSLNELGLDAYYFPQGSGLYRVRFGDFATRDQAVREAERLVGRKIIGDYFVVRPEEHPVRRPDSPGDGLRDRIAATAAGFLGVPYAWGGTSRDEGVDCSGLVRAVYLLNGLGLPRAMADQFRTGTIVTRDRLRKGDLVFFAASPGRPPSHVGIYVGGNVFIHAPGKGQKVREASLKAAYFRERFSGARTYLD